MSQRASSIVTLEVEKADSPASRDWSRPELQHPSGFRNDRFDGDAGYIGCNKNTNYLDCAPEMVRLAAAIGYGLGYSDYCRRVSLRPDLSISAYD